MNVKLKFVSIREPPRGFNLGSGEVAWLDWFLKDPLVHHVENELERTRLEAGRPVRLMLPFRREKMT